MELLFWQLIAGAECALIIWLMVWLKRTLEHKLDAENWQHIAGMWKQIAETLRDRVKQLEATA